MREAKKHESYKRKNNDSFSYSFYTGVLKWKGDKESDLTTAQYPDIAIKPNNDKKPLAIATQPSAKVEYKILNKGKKPRKMVDAHFLKLQEKQKSLLKCHAWDWLGITEEEMKNRIKKIGKHKCLKCGKDACVRSDALCQWHMAAYNRWRKPREAALRGF